MAEQSSKITFSPIYYPDESKKDSAFIGFTFNGVHSSDLGITRVSNGNRYDEILIPNFSDTTAQVTGSDGMLYWESFYNNRVFNVQIAFDHITEKQLRDLRQTFNGKVYGDLIFDEWPYKKYHVKVQSPPQIQTICFNEEYEEEGVDKIRRIYKGEGTIQFVAYYPFARSVHKYLNDNSAGFAPEELRTPVDEWFEDSGILPERGVYDKYSRDGENPIRLYNGGDLPADCKIFIPADFVMGTGRGTSPLSQIELKMGNPNEIGATVGAMQFNEIQMISGDSHICINSATNLIEGYSDNGGSISSYVNFIKTGNLYNKYLVAGDFFKIPLGESFVQVNEGCAMRNVAYDYLYY